MSGITDRSTNVPIPKVPTGVHGLDEILSGGLPQGGATLILGGPGTGKTILGLDLLFQGILAGEPGIFVTFEESAAAIRRNALALGWDLAAAESDGMLFLMQADVPVDLVISGEFSIDGLLAILDGQAKAMGAQRLVIDAIDGLLRLFEDNLRRQNQLYILHSWLRRQQVTAVLTAKHTKHTADSSETLDYLVDCILRLDQRVVNQVTTRRLRVLKYRGSDFLSNEHPYIIASTGVRLMPVSSAQLRQQPLGTPIPTGNLQLDRLLQGGIRRASSVLIAGSSGTGKTTLACTYTVAACQRGERVLYISFEESQAALVNTMLSPGVDLHPALDAKQLQILATMPESLGVEEHLMRILDALDQFQPQHLVLEAISACWRMGSQHAAFDFLVRLIDACKERGITSLYTNQIRKSRSGYTSGVEEIGGIGLSSLMDTLLLLEQQWWQQAYTRRLLIIKARGSGHSHHFHSFTISDDGITIDETPHGVVPDDLRRELGERMP
ncbi:MAG: circadian clock protein KaiC [Caldilineaceae bacterium]|nr:circadian clock protein KaiC [Caldilineaceae bacterium]